MCIARSGEANEEKFTPNFRNSGKRVVILKKTPPLRKTNGWQKDFMWIKGLYPSSEKPVKSSLTDKMIESAYMTGILPIKNMTSSLRWPIFGNIPCRRNKPTVL